MSLVHHVSSIEGVDREREEDIDTSDLILTRTLSHKISYDLFPTHSHVPEFVAPLLPEKIEAVAAYEITTLKRVAQVAVGCVICMLASGITFGFAALKSVLVDQEVYRDSCTTSELEKSVAICYLQDQRYEKR